MSAGQKVAGHEYPQQACGQINETSPVSNQDSSGIIMT